MSRLKGADLGVVTPSLASLGIAGALNYRGPYSPSTVYAVNDVVTYQGVAYRAGVPNGPGVAAQLSGVASGQAAGGTTSGSFVIPASANVGDVAYVVLCGWSGSQTLTLSGWTQVVGFTYTTTQTDGNWLAVYRKTLVAGDPGSTVNVSWSFSDYVAYTCRSYYGIHDVASAAASNTLTTPAVTPTTYPSTVISIAGVGASVGSNLDVNVTAPSGTSNFYAGIRVASGGHNNHWAAAADETVAAGASTPRTFGDDQPAATGRITAAVAVKPTGGSVAFTPWMWAPLSPTSALNYRGQWSATAAAYSVNDVALRFGIPYVAMVAPGSIDPVGGITSLAAQTATGGWLGQKTATPFTVSAPIAVSQVKYKTGTGGASTTGGLNVGIATSVGASPTYIAQSTSHGGVAAGGTDTVAFASPVLLVPGTTYYFICDEVVIGSTTTPTFTGAIATVGFYTFGTNYATTQSTLYVPFELDGNPWQSLDPAVQQMNYRGAYDSAQTYSPNDVATSNGLLWLAINAAGVAQTPTASYGTVTTASVNASLVAGYENGSIATTGQSNGGSVSAKLTKFVIGQTITINAFAVQIANGGTVAMTVGIATAAPGTADPNGISWFTQNSVQCKASVAGGLVTGGGELAAAFPGVFTLPPGTYWFVSTAGSGNTVNTKDVLITGGTLRGAITSVPDSGHIGTGGTVISGGETNQGQNFYLSNTANAVNPWAPLTSPTESVNTVASSGAAVTLPDVTTATMHRVTLTAATPAITLPAPGAGKSFTVELVQDATGGRAPTWATPSGAIRWPGGAAPTITATANAIDVITFICIGGVNWYGFVAGQAFA